MQVGVGVGVEMRKEAKKFYSPMGVYRLGWQAGWGEEAVLRPVGLLGLLGLLGFLVDL